MNSWVLSKRYKCKKLLKQATELFKGRFTYALLFAFEGKVLGVGGGGIKIVELILKTLS